MKTREKTTTPSAQRLRGAPEAASRDDWQAMYHFVEHWQSELYFYGDELRFFRNLLDKYFLWFIEESHLADTRTLTTRLQEQEKERERLVQKASQRGAYLGRLMANPLEYQARDYPEEQDELAGAMAAFALEQRQLKQRLYQLAEHILQSEKAKHLLPR
jgi:hypothetical protein